MDFVDMYRLKIKRTALHWLLSNLCFFLFFFNSLIAFAYLSDRRISALYAVNFHSGVANANFRQSVQILFIYLSQTFFMCEFQSRFKFKRKPKYFHSQTLFKGIPFIMKLNCAGMYFSRYITTSVFFSVLI